MVWSWEFTWHWAAVNWRAAIQLALHGGIGVKDSVLDFEVCNLRF